MIVQELPGVTVPHVFDCLKCDELAPQRLTELTTRFAAPVLETVTVLEDDVLLRMVPKLSDVGETEIVGTPLEAAPCVTVNVWPAMVIVPVLDCVVLLGPTE